MSYSYQWERDDGDIAGAAGIIALSIPGNATEQYIPVAGDAGHTIRFRLTDGTNIWYSDWSSAIAAAPPPSSIGALFPTRMPLSSGNGAVVYVDPTNETGAASDSYTTLQAESASTPWRTIQHAINTVPIAGSIINVIGTNKTIAVTDSIGTGFGKWQKAGDPSDPTTIQAVTRHGITVIGSGSSQKQGMYVGGSTSIRSSGLRISGFKFSVTGTNSNGIAIDINSEWIEIFDALITGCGGQGVVWKGTGAGGLAPCRHLWLYACELWLNGLQPSNQFFGSSGTHDAYFGQSAGDNIDKGGVEQGIVANCIFHDSMPGFHLQLGPQFRDGLITNNTFYDNPGNPTGGYPASNSAGDAVTFYSDSSATQDQVATQNNKVRNNIMVSMRGHAVRGSAGYSIEQYDADYNLGYNNQKLTPIGDSNDFATMYGTHTVGVRGPNNITGSDPLLNASTYRLGAGSPAIDAGDPNYCPPFDKDGVARTDATLGAYVP